MSWDVVQAYREGRAQARTGDVPQDSDVVLSQARRLGWLSRRAEETADYRAELASCLQWFVEEHPSSPVLIAFSRTRMGLLDMAARQSLLAAWRERMRREDTPARALLIAAHFMEQEDWHEAELLLLRAVAIPHDHALCAAVTVAVYEQPINPQAPPAERRLEQLGAFREAADKGMFARISMIMARMALALQRWADAATWAEEASANTDGTGPPGSAEIIGLASLAQGDLDKARLHLSQSAGRRNGEPWNFRMTMQVTGMLYNATWRNALIACLEHRSGMQGSDGIRKNLVSWKQRMEQDTTPPRI